MNITSPSSKLVGWQDMTRRVATSIRRRALEQTVIIRRGNSIDNADPASNSLRAAQNASQGITSSRYLTVSSYVWLPQSSRRNPR